MSLENIILTAGGGGLSLIIIILSVIQISPIKINPWSSLLKSVGKGLNKDISNKMEAMTKDICNVKHEIIDLKKQCEEDKATACRIRILHFNDEIMHGYKHSKEHFDQILMDITYYEHYCAEHTNYKNSIADMAIKRITDVYMKCLNTSDFL